MRHALALVVCAVAVCAQYEEEATGGYEDQPDYGDDYPDMEIPDDADAGDEPFDYPQFEEIFASLDANSDGKIDVPEVRRWMMLGEEENGLGMSEEDAVEPAQEFLTAGDNDGNGHLDLEELKSLILAQQEAEAETEGGADDAFE
eukprot:TRINITY_DN31155_c0_g1_i1.p1 TRINITY_DN31155_c0_g1~~TRINITY_DN31155_c0_g1_i1.p1  ORF type:complete len:145 (+),score=60.03 TRINITY_DN31155_c0_g1_i1:63-497(+)